MNAPRPWPPGTSEMAARIRTRDWSGTPLGPAEQWPQSLKTAVAMILEHPFPHLVLWGPERVQLYNDAYRALMGARHPAGLGQPARECWPGGWRIDDEVCERVWRGESLSFQDAPFPVPRPGAPEEAWFTLSCSPLPDEAGEIGGVLVTVVETTDKIRAQEALRESEARKTFLLRLGDALRPLADAGALQREASRVFREHLGACRVVCLEALAGGELLAAADDTAPGFASVAGSRFRLAELAPALAAGDRAGQGARRGGAAAAPPLAGAGTAWSAAAGGGAWACAPLAREGRVVAMLTAHFPAAHAWTPGELALLDETAERTWAAVERARAEAALRESEERLRLFGEASSDVIWMRDAETLRMEYLSPAFEVVYGVPRESILGTDPGEGWAKLILPEDREQALAAMQRVRSGERLTFECRIRRPDGEVRWLRDTDFPVPDAQGRVRRVGGIGQDVTEQKRAEAALRASAERHRLIVSSARDYAILVIDPRGVIESWSPGAEAVFGWTAEEILGQPVEITFTPEDRQRGVPEEERRVARAEGSAPDVRWHLRKDGGRVFIEGTTRAIADDSGALTGFLKIGQDVTRRRQAEAELHQLNESLELRVEARTADLMRAIEARRRILQQLVTVEEEERSRISRELHDHFGQQITGLLLGLRALASEVGASPRLEDLERLADGIARDLQEMAVQLRPPALDNLGLQAALRAHLEDWSRRHGVEADFHAVGLEGEGVPHEMETTLYRVAQEGLNNILKHAAARRVSLVLERRRGVVSLILEDDGTGFDVEETLARPDKATRLGVRGMRERVALLGGELEIESSPGSGTSLFVRIPAPAPVPPGDGGEPAGTAA